jgi:cytochrome bd-type quinol oxidase subunit 1
LLGLRLFDERLLGPRRHLAVAIGLALGSWLSDYFIIVSNGFMHHPFDGLRGVRQEKQSLIPDF